MDKLNLLITKDEMSSLILHGPEGAGKLFLIRKRLHDIFAEQAKTRLFEQEIKINSNTYPFYMRYSNVHYEIDISDLVGNERLILLSVLNSLKENPTSSLLSYKIIVIRHAHNISRDTWLSLRKLMETNIESMRFIFTTHSLVSIPEPIRSRTVSIFIPFKTKEEIEELFGDSIGYEIWKGNLNYWHHRGIYNKLPIENVLIDKINVFISNNSMSEWNELRKEMLKHISLGVLVKDIIKGLKIDPSTYVDGLERIGNLDKEILLLEYVILKNKNK